MKCINFVLQHSHVKHGPHVGHSALRVRCKDCGWESEWIDLGRRAVFKQEQCTLTFPELKAFGELFLDHCEGADRPSSPSTEIN